MVRIINSGTPDPMPEGVEVYYGGIVDYDPSMEIQDIRLSPGFYLIEGSRIGTRENFEGTTKEGIVVKVDRRNMRIPNLGRVIKKADSGCEKAVVGDYVLMPAYGGNMHDDKKALVVCRKLDDPDDLWVLHEDFVFAVVPPKEEQEENG